jgi:transposase
VRKGAARSNVPRGLRGGPCPGVFSRGEASRRQDVGDRAANRALHMAIVVRLRHDPHTRAYVEWRTREDLSKVEVIPCLKCYLAREVYRTLRADLEDLDDA